MINPDTEATGSPGGSRRRLGLAALVGLIAVVAGWILGSNTAPIGVATTTTVAVDSTDAQSLSTLASGPGTTESRPPLRGLIELFPDSATLEGSVALAVGASGGLSEFQNLWIIHPGGRMVQRVDVPLRLEGIHSPMLFVGHYLLVAGSREILILGSDMEDPARPLVTESSFLVPGASATSAWIVGGTDSTWIAEFDGDTGQLGDRFDVGDVGWPLGSFHDGVLFTSNSPLAEDRYTVVRAGRKPETLVIEGGPQTFVYTVAGNLAALVSPGPVISVIDLDNAESIARLDFDSGEGPVGSVCFSPDLSFLAAVSSTGPVGVYRIATAESIGTLMTSEVNWGVGWTSPSQLALITETPSGTRLELFNADTGVTTDVAELQAPGLWRLTTSGPIC